MTRLALLTGTVDEQCSDKTAPRPRFGSGKLDLHLIFGPPATPSFWQGPLGTLIVAGVGAFATAVFAFGRTILLARRDRHDAIRSARLVIYAQLHRLTELSRGQLKFLSDSNNPPYIWIPAFNLNLPSAGAFEQLNKLSATEVYEVTSFYYAYQEQLGYMMGNARPVCADRVPGIDPPFMPPGTKVESPVFGYDCSDHTRRCWLIDAVGKTQRRAQRARRAVGKKIIENYGKDRVLCELVEAHQKRDEETEEHGARRVHPGGNERDLGRCRSP